MAELALAIVPLCLSALKGIHVVHKRLKILRHHGKEIKRLRTRFSSQTEIFLDECQLLFQELLGPEEAEALVVDADHPRWSSSDLDGQVETYLGRRYSSFQDTVSEIDQYIISLDTSLGDSPASDGRQGAPSGDSRQRKVSERMSQAVDIMVNKSKYEEAIQGLKDAIQEFKRLRKTAAKLQKRQATSSCCVKRARPLPPSWQTTAQHSRSFYEALRDFWSCSQAQHTGHDVRLFLNSHPDGSLRVIVRYRTQSTYWVQDGFVDLLVRSQTLHLIQISIQSGADHGHSSEVERPRKKARVRFADDCAASTSSVMRKASGGTMTQTTTTMTTTNNPAQPLDHNPAAIEGGALNLCSSKDMCNHLCSHARTTPSRLSHCGGYIDTSDDLRHYLYPVCDPKECMSSRAKNEPTTLNQIFKLPVERTISVAQQVGLALKLVKAVLQYHATPWLQPLWRLQDLAYFPTDEGLSASLSTLHISTELSHHNQNLPQHGPDALMTDVSGGGGGGGGINADTSALDDAQLEYGIRNLTMHSLGVALLQIGQWDLLRPDSIVEIRKVASLAERDSRLGPRYQRLTQKCLDCDFGFGKDLAQPELQSAVYRDVVCELEDLVSSLEGR